ncbi:MAG: 50S ribosomal protein L4 [Planctomycetota bacterium]
MVSVPVYQFDTGEVGSAEVDETRFGEEIRWRVLRDAVVMYQANRRVGTHAAKTRAEVAGSKKKPWRQKGTGRARAGTRKSPIWRGGGVVFAKKPRDFSYSMPRKALRQALRSAILGKLLDGEVALVENLAISEPKTKEMVKVLKGLEIGGSALVVHQGGSENDAVVKSTRNITRTVARSAGELNAYDVVTHERLVLTKDGLDQLIERVGHGDS